MKRKMILSEKFSWINKFLSVIVFLWISLLFLNISNVLANEVVSNPTSTASTGSAQLEFVNPLGSVDSISEFVAVVLGGLRNIVVVLSILFIVIGGVMYIISAGDEKMITRAKNTITSAMIGLAIALAAPTFLKEILTVLSGGSTGSDPNDLVNNALTLKEIALRTLNLLLSISGILAIIGLVIGGSFYFTSYGDEKRIETGKKIITYSIIGIVVIMAALTIVKQIAALMM